ncbi:RNA polymerase Rpc34 subunit-domain-containing protein [Leucosporidium creatinivorum]|uniref:RNA polymerase Rpc34 subunit-domain-containing protein n=1 Tax=Leucosporidium creatinivorum TaxID=106004 RepID=A0A1Y2G1Y7_9BASI|nr:RNA polymerase Rpc34 subunit-domain-containing protein [Leucosporidium creatinivorum]
MAPTASSSKGGKLTALEAKIVKVGLAAKGASIGQAELLAQCGLTISSTTQDAMNSLLRKNLAQMLKNSNGDIVFRFVGKDEAKAMGSMDSEEKLVFDQIKAAGNMGIWTKSLTTNTGLPRTTITKVLKTLEGRKTVKTVKSVKAPTRKIYMLANLTPSVELTGGPWFTDNELDTEFVDLLKKCAYKYLEMKSVPKTKSDKRRIYPVSATRYLPTVNDILAYIDSLEVAISVELQDVHVQSLLELMVYDGTVEKIFINSDMAVNGSSSAAHGKKLNGKDKGKGRKRKAPESSDEESDSDDDGPRRRKGKGKANGRASKKRKTKLAGDDSEEEPESESDDFDSDEDPETARVRRANKAEEGGKTSTRRKRKRQKRAIKSDDEDRATSESSGHESSDDDEDVKKKGKGKGKKGKSAEDELAEERENMKDYVYRLVRPYAPVVGWTDMPCGKCPSESFCTEPNRSLAVKQPRAGASRPKVGIELEGGIQGVGMIGGAGAAIGVSTAKWGEVKGAVGNAVAPVNPRDCTYFKTWLDF